MSKKSNVHPDYYKTAGRDRQDDAAAARQARAMAKTSPRERPDRMEKAFYFARPAPALPAPAGRPGERMQKESPSRAGSAGKVGARKASAPRRTATPKRTASTRRKAGRTAKPATTKK